jgi:hypothetical protein
MIMAVAVRIPDAERQIEDRFRFGLGQAEPVADPEMRAGDRFDAALGEKFVLGGIDLGGIGRDRGDPLHAQAGACLEDAVRCAGPGTAGDMMDLFAQPRVELMPLHDARGGAAIGDRVRPAAGQLVDRVLSIGAIHLDDAFGRGPGRHQHAGKMDADSFRHNARVPGLNDAVDARHDDSEPDLV